MTRQRVPYLIVGGGLAAASAAESIAKKAPGQVCLVSSETHLPYLRPPLSKAVLSGQADPDSVLLRQASFYRDKHIAVRLGDAAVSLDTTQALLTLQSGVQLGYEQLLIATGLAAAPLNVPGFSLPGVFTLRSLDDALALRDEMAPGRAVVVVGGGFIGCEVAATATACGAHVHLVEVDDVLMGRAVGPEVGKILTEHHHRAGVHLHLGVGVTEILGDDRATAVRLTTGEVVDCDLVVVGVGSRPTTEWLQDSLVELAGGGVVVDEHCRTSIGNIYAAGDIAARYMPSANRYMRVEHESNAQQQGAVAARNMLGRPTALSAMPFVWSRQFDLDLWCLGEAHAHDAVDIEGDLSTHRFVALYRLAGKPVAVFGSNTPLAAARTLLRKQQGFTARELWASSMASEAGR
ncbi:FAD-dependent oxidoreductase [Mycolicibacterium sp. BiH015]|uniref:NAD(P)/FAD-dependent oxidoreductase n=1 Tax=Mycolicibacterium sp. BiH015 TaxID=3018808 RepID=UPI0022E5F3BA|nr:FAD-dependent oxidoreductase [Mycolicibacterium sp. BiH015]MDA2893269.1 FAD-dependent oxidoreductase [Mycolicibacterium sp. BiH015]